VKLAQVEDAIDSEHLVQVMQSRGYAFISQRMSEMRDQKLRELVQPSGPERTAELRGWIQAIETCLRVPEILKAEFKEKEKHERT